MSCVVCLVSCCLVSSVLCLVSCWCCLVVLLSCCCLICYCLVVLLLLSWCLVVGIASPHRFFYRSCRQVEKANRRGYPYNQTPRQQQHNKTTRQQQDSTGGGSSKMLSCVLCLVVLCLVVLCLVSCSHLSIVFLSYCCLVVFLLPSAGRGPCADDCCSTCLEPLCLGSD